MLEIRPGDWSGGEAEPRVSGRVGAPSLGRASRNYISLFVNRRSINSRLLSWAVEEAYHGLLPAGKHPVAVINIEVPTGEVDVNIHPAKSEVKFRDERRVFVAVQKAVRGTLVAQAPVPRIEEATVDFAVPAPSTGFRGSTAPHRRQAKKGVADAIPAPLALTLPVLRVVGQVMGSYIVAEGPDGLYLIDQHAAHERIVYEEVKRQRRRREVSRQGLLSPATFEVTPGQDEVLRARYGELADFGFDIEPFGDRTYLVRAVPELVSADDWSVMLRELLDALAGESGVDFEEKVAISIACHRRAVRAGQVLSDSEMRALVRRLESTELPHTCPHGRPTLIHLSNGQLRRHFGRS
jgi:DNA mismatch repair protein MutL